MIWTELYLNTPIPELPKIINSNFSSFSNYIDIFYDGSTGILKVPLETSGRVKGASGEFVSVTVDNLTVKNQYTNLYDNITTADYQYYKTFTEPAVVPRDASTTSSPAEHAGFKYIDVIQPYYKIPNNMTIGLVNNNISQVVRFLFDTSVATSNPYNILLSEETQELYTIAFSDAETTYIELIMTNWDSSWGPTWEPFKYGVADASWGSGSSYTLYPATDLVLGGIMVGNSLKIDGAGILDVSDGYDDVIYNYVDGSLATIDSYQIIQDASIAIGLAGSAYDPIQDASISTNKTNIANLDTSRGTLEGLINTNISSISDIETHQAIQDTSIVGKVDQTYVDGSLALKLDNTTDTFTGDLTLDGSLSVDIIKFNTGASPSEEEGQLWWNSDDRTLNVATGLGPVMQVGQEEYIKVYNNTGSTLLNGKIVQPGLGVTGGVSHFEYALSDVYSNCKALAVVTEDISVGTWGFATTKGYVRNIDTTHLVLGPAWLSDVSPGEFTSTKPNFPSYTLYCGSALDISTNGNIYVLIRDKVDDTFNNFWNGLFRETFNFDVSSNGTTITGYLSPKDGHPNMTMIFDDGFDLLDTSPDASIDLTAGTDTNPQLNYIYVPKDTKVLTKSISGWPDNIQYIKVGIQYVQTAITVQTNGALKNDNWNDGLQDTSIYQGHLSHLTERIRKSPAVWESGIEGNVIIDTSSTPDDVYFSNTAGEVYQLHKHAFPEFDMSSGDYLHIVNHDTSSYTRTNNLNTISNDAAGNTLNNTSFSFVVWGVINQNEDNSKVMLNLPSGTYAYGSPTDAENDALNYSVYNIPSEFLGTGFLISRLILTYFNDSWTLHSIEDLRGKLPNTSAGGGAGGTGVTSFTGLTDTPSAYTGDSLKMVRVASGETTLEFSDDFYEKTYIDSSLTSRDTSISDLYFGRPWVSEASLGATFEWNTGVLDVSVQAGFWDRTGTDLSPSNSGDDILLASNEHIKWNDGSIYFGSDGSILNLYVEGELHTKKELKTTNLYNYLNTNVGPILNTFHERDASKTANLYDDAFRISSHFYNNAASPELIEGSRIDFDVTGFNDGSESMRVIISTAESGLLQPSIEISQNNIKIYGDIIPIYDNTVDIGWNINRWQNLFLSGYINLDEISEPATPDASTGSLYVGDDAGTTKLYFKDTSDNVTDLLSGSISNLNDIEDVSVSGAVADQVLTWKGTYWEPEDVSAAGGGVTQGYVDASINAVRAEYIPEVSIGSGLFWVNGLLDVSVLGDVTQSYVDASLAERDSSISLLNGLINTNITDISNLDTSIGTLEGLINTNISDIATIQSTYIPEVSTGSGLFWVDGLLDVSVIGGVNSLNDLSDVSISDVSEGDSLFYTNGFWINSSTLEASTYFVTQDEFDSSINYIMSAYIPDVSTGTGLFWVNGQLDVSVEGSSTLETLTDVSVSGKGIDQVLTWKGTYWEPEDVSAAGGGVTQGYVDASLAERDSSITLLNTWTAANDASIQRIDASLNDVVEADTLFYTKTEVDASFALIVNVDSSFADVWTKFGHVDTSLNSLTGAEAWNGLTKTDSSIGLGGTLIENTDVSLGSYSFQILDSDNFEVFKVEDGSTLLQSYAASDKYGYILLDGSNNTIDLTISDWAGMGTDGINISNSGIALDSKNVVFRIGDSSAIISTTGADGAGLRYGADYSGNYVDRTLIDKNYADTRLTGYDVSIIDVSQGDIIEFDASEGKWVNAHTEDIDSILDGKQNILSSGTPDSSASGVAGQWLYDASYLYICNDASTWGRLLFENDY